ncbi:Pyridinium-3,5-bisthiocarboxylic acid mononucleotide nickel insertion protein [Methanimicrococcus sp. At1]|uniref:Putative nickel insertion protein n=1 Tax=Methanimicrococcus hacksteinii TaxID=3028293 RepID=A0ABU3VQK7_9EURY|nr:nickel pincer cofactor biosynthesis protein LarC [Methanimicrococcus sp. At1]MDV0445688.1 Pyridinium-3,5-bisthiocarboxylic acid mononucleotide nickel insertion protein [Methanimicrococcus sp. At1]
MKALYFEPFSGASGDMILGALIDLGASVSFIQKHIEPLANVSMAVQKTVKKGISALDVSISENSPNNERHFSEICEIISGAGLPEEVEKNAFAVFEIIAKAESAVHGKPLSELHFHETGQDDAIADVVGCCLAFYDLKNNPETQYCEILCGDINVGGGFVNCCHGKLPVPAPATLEILKSGGLPFYADGNRELLTPTGAAVLSHFAAPAQIRTSKTVCIGYGAGDAETESPNVLRASLIEYSGCVPLLKDQIEVLETNVDDVTGEILGHLVENLMAAGALDVSVFPIYMKKGRPAHMIKVISKADRSEQLARQIIRETGSLGVRIIPTKHRVSVKREIVSLPIQISGRTFEIPFKIARFEDGELITVSAEYENCKQISSEIGLPLRTVIQKAEEEGRRRFC